MPKPAATDTDKANLETDIRRKGGLDHLRVRRRGNALVLYSEEDGEATNHVRLLKQNQSTWVLSFADHRGRWESTPFSGTRGELLDMLVEQFPWTLGTLE